MGRQDLEFTQRGARSEHGAPRGDPHAPNQPGTFGSARLGHILGQIESDGGSIVIHGKNHRQNGANAETVHPHLVRTQPDKDNQGTDGATWNILSTFFLRLFGPS